MSPAALRAVPTDRTRTEIKHAKEALADTSEEFLECRDLHHRWEVVGCFYVGTEVHRKLVCTRCECDATDRWTSRGERIARVYKYPNGYQTKGVKITPMDIRREVLGRITVFADEKELLDSLFSGRRRRA